MPCHRATALLLAAGLAGAAQANRPLNTDTADTIADGRCQIEPFAASSRSDGAPTERFWLLQLNCGVAAHTQLGGSLSRASADDTSEHAAAVGGKTSVIELKSGQTGLALGYGLSAVKPSGGSWSGEGVLLNGIASREIAEGWLVHANLGWSRSRSARRSSTTWGLATEYTVAPGWVLSAETYGDDRERPWAGVGALWQVNERFSVNASYGVQNSSPRVRQASVGFLIEF